MSAGAEVSAERDALGDAYGDNPRYHAIKDNVFVCTAPPEAKCRTSPTCECENWCGCDGSPEDATDTHGEGEHCCMTTVQPGQGCWMEPWVNTDLDGGFDHNAESSPAEYNLVTGEHTFPDGPVMCHWADGVWWTYVEPVSRPGATP